MDELKPCPFCGKEATRFSIAVIGCEYCQIWLIDANSDHALATWNQRAERATGVCTEEHEFADGDKYNWYYCALCEEHLLLNKDMQLPKYCPNCGAKMESEEPTNSG
jgi:transcription initiation factor IIE alpha subunit